MMDEIPHTHCGRCVVIAGLPSMHETPPNKNTDEKPMCAATCNLIQEPMAMSQNKYHTCFGSDAKGAAQAVPLHHFEIFFTNQWYHTSAQAVPHLPKQDRCGGNFLRDGTTPTQVGVY
ncbi:hypothetical protein BS47DRAFT_1369843 [Hydnum rufescens UP504]|uniref:Uncharacterized protein n=1 Tax=Hydnum rufescens UP504 TaxID=1448309 RepID=A0A9P6ABZ7_9AGAM|nr:hypothetical protein BS47DRAFT_1369843 [Hydnum rufescens UP504]